MGGSVEYFTRFRRSAFQLSIRVICSHCKMKLARHFAIFSKLAPMPLIKDELNP
jgi:hypothetical protein